MSDLAQNPPAVRTVLAGLMLSIFLSALDQTIVAVSLPAISADFADLDLLAWVISAYMVAMTVSMPIYGKLGDLYGRRRLMLFAIVVFTAASLLCGLAQSMGQLVLARVLQGIGAGGLMAVSQAIIGDIVPPRERGRYQGYFSSMYAIASVAGPVLGGLLTEYLSWRWVFWINLPIGLLALAISRRTLVGLPVPRRQPVIDYLGIVLMVVGLTALLLAITQIGQGAAWSDPALLGLFALAALALLLFVGGLFALRIVKRWLSERLLPETNMDAGMRASLVTLVGYLGFVLLAMLVMSTLRINLTSLTWVVSALSVGIGFGLQAIVQNFISGLILLTERPVKVGDWVSLGGVEGDIRRINVRATEIQMGDRSTVIVPNSQFISQTVRNVTMGNALGVVGVNLTLPLDTDAMKVRELLLQAFAEHPAILDAPAPSVTFKDLASNGLVLNASGFVNSPRSVAGARSDLLFTILDRLRSEGIALSSPQSLLMIQDGGPASAAPAPATPD